MFSGPSVSEGGNEGQEVGKKVHIQLEQNFPCDSCHSIREPGWHKRWGGEIKYILKMNGMWRALVRNMGLEVKWFES